MTSPTNFDQVGFGGVINDAAASITGNKNLGTDPALLMSALNSGASKSDLASLNAFVGGVDAQAKLAAAKAGGTKVPFTAGERSALDAMNIHYADFDYTPQVALQDAQAKAAQSGQHIVMGPDGKPQTNAAGQYVLAGNVKQGESKHNGWFDSPGSFLHHATHNVATNVIGEAGNVGQYLFGQTIANAADPTKALLENGGAGTVGQMVNIGQSGDDEYAQQMRDSGYDPANRFSRIAYFSQGHAVRASTVQTQVSTFDAEHPDGVQGFKGQDLITIAQQFLTHPKAFSASVEHNAAISGDEKDRTLALLGSKEFGQFLQRYQSAKVTPGDIAMSAAGVDPVHDAKAFAYGSAATNFVASFIDDPTLILGKANKIWKTAGLAVGGAHDATSMQRILQMEATAANKLRYPGVFQAQRGADHVIEQSRIIREATAESERLAAAGDKAGAAAAMAKVGKAYDAVRNGPTSGMEALIGDINGTERIIGLDKATGTAIVKQGAPITSREVLGERLASWGSMTQISRGKAAVENGYMPGAMSRVGALRVRLGLSGLLTGKAAQFNLRNESDLRELLANGTDAMGADGLVVAARGSLDDAQKVADAAFNDAKAARFGGASAKQGAFNDVATAQSRLREATAVAANGGSKQAVRGAGKDVKLAERALAKAKAEWAKLDEEQSVLVRESAVQADEASTGLLSAQRAAQQAREVTPERLGDAQLNLLRTGTVDGKGRDFKRMLSARFDLMARRMSTFLPNDLELNTANASHADTVYRYAAMYMNKGHAATLAAKWATGDEASRKALIIGLQQQTMHAAGLGLSDPGREAIARVEAHLGGPNVMDAGSAAGQRYSHIPGLDEVLDPATGTVTRYATFPSMVQNKFTLMSFKEMQQHAARYGVFGNLVGRWATKPLADLVMSPFRLIQLLKPSTIVRNVLDAHVMAALYGKSLDMQFTKGIIGEGGVPASKLAARVAKAGPISWLARRDIERHLAGEQTSRWFEQIGGKYIVDAADKGVWADLAAHRAGARRAWDITGADEAASIAQDGYIPKQIQMRGKWQTERHERVGFDLDETDGATGAARYVQALNERFAEYPQLTKLLVGKVERGDKNVEDVVDLLMTDKVIAARMSMARHTKIVEDASGNTREVTTPEEHRLAMERVARAQLEETHYLLTNSRNELADPLVKFMKEHGAPPDVEWLIKNVPHDARPVAALTPQYEAVTREPGVAGMAKAVLDVGGKGYERFIENPIQRLSTIPVTAMHYGKNRVWMEDFEKSLVDGGLSTEAASRIAHERAMARAFTQSAHLIDDPTIKTQFDEVTRNMISYPRAMQAQIRRFGTAMMVDPTQFRKAMLLLQAGDQSGFLWKDEYGQRNFTYPGSGAFVNTIARLGSLFPGMGDFAQLPTNADLSGQLKLVAPGYDNPFAFSMTPMVNIPMRSLFRFFPGHAYVLNEIDSAVNGGIVGGSAVGAGKIADQFKPTALSAFWNWLADDGSKGGALASATQAAVANLDANGDGPPENATPAEVDAWVQRIQVQVRNQMFGRAVFKLFAAAPPGAPENATPASQADEFYRLQGLTKLSDEFKTILSDLGGDHAAAQRLWAQMHPDGLIYTQPTTHSGAKSAFLPPTEKVALWAQDNQDWIRKYGAVAGYFAPEDPGAFNQTAYRTEVELGLRVKYNAEDWFRQYRITTGATQYYDAKNQADAKIADAQARHDDAAVRMLKQDWAQQAAAIKSMNPLYAQKAADYGSQIVTAQAAVAALRGMVKSGDTPKGFPTDTVTAMVQSFDNMQQWRTAHKGSSAALTAQRNAAEQGFDQYMTGLVKGSPQLMDLYSGVFRVLDSNLATATQINGGS